MQERLMIPRVNKMLQLAALGLPGAGMLGIPVRSQDPQQPAPDNSKTNKQERSGATADKQKLNPADRETARKIRSALHDDSTLSTYAHNGPAGRYRFACDSWRWPPNCRWPYHGHISGNGRWG